MTYADDIRTIRESLSNGLLMIFTVFAIPSLVISLNRIPSIGWQPVMGLHIAIVIITMIFTLFRKRISYVYKAGFVVVIFYLTALGGILQFGLIAGGIPAFVIAAPVATLFFGLEFGILLLFLIFLSETAVGYLIISGALRLNIDLTVYATSVSTWVTNVFALILGTATLIGLIHGFNGRMIKALRELRRYQYYLKKQQRELEKTIAERTKELRRSNEDLEGFARIAAHDMRSPLNTISGYAQLLALEYQGRLDQKGDTYIDNITSGVQYASEMIDDLLDYSEINKDRTHPCWVDMNDIVDKVKNNLSADIHESGASIGYNGLPAVYVVESQVMRVIQNLFSNSIKYRDQNRCLMIQVDADTYKDHWKISVSDNGIGIAAKHFERIFEMFQRVEENPVERSAGIGLAACKRIVERHGGKIWVESEPAKGSTFHFTLQRD